jgi:predicted O-methyltransferase YrrM
MANNGGGQLIWTELEPARAAQARANLAAASLDDLVETRAGDAPETLARDLPKTIDLVFFDGAKGLDPRVLALLEPRWRPGALPVADNADQCPEYLARVLTDVPNSRPHPMSRNSACSTRRQATH